MGLVMFVNIDLQHLFSQTIEPTFIADFPIDDWGMQISENFLQVLFEMLRNI
jgi:hypothetical protein